MKDINLLPKIKKEKNRFAAGLNILIAILVVVLIASGALSFYIYRSMNSLSYKLSELEKVNMELNTLLIKLRSYKDFSDKVGYKSEIVKDITDNAILWSKKFYTISEVIPKNVFITSFSGGCDNVYNEIEIIKQGEDSPGNKLTAFTLEGYSSDYTNISKFLIGLKTIPEIIDPWVSSINEVAVSGINMMYFKIDAYWNIEFFTKDIKPNIENAQTQDNALDIEGEATQNQSDLDLSLE